MSTPIKYDIQQTCHEMSLLRVPELKAVCRSIGLPLSGRKADLQARIKEYVENSLRPNHVDPFRPKAIMALIQKSKVGDVLPTYESILQALRTGAFTHPVATGHAPPSSLFPSDSVDGAPHDESGDQHQTARAVGRKGSPSSVFYPSPFYNLKRMVSGSPKMAAKSPGRGTCNMKFRLSETESKFILDSKDTKLLLFCGPVSQGNRVHIQFPHPNEIKLNDNMIKDNVRGLKNKIGTAKPADLTPFVKHNAENYLQLVYAFTKEDFLVYLYIVTMNTPEKILEGVLARPKIVKPATLAYIKKILSEDEDDDLMTTSTIMTLQCPISYSRMKYPVKSVRCDHLQCFDAMSFILSQMQIPTWQCPVCQKQIEIKDLAVCDYVDDIIKSSNENVEQVVINSDGSWVAKEEEPENRPGKSTDTEQPAQTNIKDEDIDQVILDEEMSTKKAANDPIVISLDSDDEDDDVSLAEELAKLKNHPQSHSNSHTSPQKQSRTPDSLLNGKVSRASSVPLAVEQTSSFSPNERSISSNGGNAPLDRTISTEGSARVISLPSRSAGVLSTGSGSLSNHPVTTLNHTLQDNGISTITRLPRDMPATNLHRVLTDYNPSGHLNSQHDATLSNLSSKTGDVHRPSNSSSSFNGAQKRASIPNILGSAPLSNQSRTPDNRLTHGTSIHENPRLELNGDQSLLFGGNTGQASGNLAGVSPAENSRRSNSHDQSQYRLHSNAFHSTAPPNEPSKNTSPGTTVAPASVVGTNTRNTQRGPTGDVSQESVEQPQSASRASDESSARIMSPSHHTEPVVSVSTISSNTRPPILPPLPSIHRPLISPSPPVDDAPSGYYPTRQDHSKAYPSTNPRNKKPPVSPFIPRKYSSVVPKKRLLSTSDGAAKGDTNNACTNHGD
ncbi:AAR121Wp [Eremothecium gossypii ATCC 10895]|uniref:AAR121Wp n=1 Tax=Eremothecium gossypii (strain ATCC 10895 / CBS 109.51 / FGSC 9923 / NRRL Y-1056) TaxID=284811 RepID=Q75EG0_EREGS|nr:AAR121Wp [Eremothecium gossypii ATCC 10895]AAS50487.1 AAR121Wp [Eremothecium gossypii ATCC 10895]AEY94774.1 FAAR121Wp [Eremothecium gossypii FDAG1]